MEFKLGDAVASLIHRGETFTIVAIGEGQRMLKIRAADGSESWKAVGLLKPIAPDPVRD